MDRWIEGQTEGRKEGVRERREWGATKCLKPSSLSGFVSCG